MSHVYLIEIGDRAVGLVAREEEGPLYLFHAAIAEAFPLDGRRFRSPEQARLAVRKLLGNGPEAPARRLPRAA